MRVYFLLSILFVSFGTSAQLPSRFDLELGLLNAKDAGIPTSLTSSRSVVIYSGADEGWMEKCEVFHSSLSRVGIDPVIYIHAKELYASDFVRRKFRSFFSQRQLRNSIVIVDGNVSSLSIVENKPNGDFDFEKGSWTTRGSSFAENIFSLGLQLKSKGLPESNFLVLTKPEFLGDISLFKGRKYNNYSGAIRRQKVGLALFEEFPALDLGDIAQSLISEYNAAIQKQNELLKESFSQFEWSWDPIQYESNENTLKEGIQYVVQIAGTYGSTVRDLLNYDKDTNETILVSYTPGPLGGDVSLKRLQATEFMYKVYIHQVRADDIFAGEEWDADVTWPEAMRNFFFTMKRQFE